MATLGMFGGSAPRRMIRLRPEDQDPMLAQMQIAPIAAPQVPKPRFTAASMMGGNDPAPAAVTEQPAEQGRTVPPMGMFGSSAPKPSKYAASGNYKPGERDWWGEISSDPLGFLLTGTDGLSYKREEAMAYQAAQAAAEERAAKEAALRQQAEAAGLDPLGVLGMSLNPTEFGKSLGTNFEARNIGAGDSAYINGRLVSAPKFGVDGGYGYTQTPEGIEWGDQRGQSYGEVTDAAVAAETGRHNRATEGIQRMNATGSSPAYEYKEVNGRLVAINKANPRDVVDIGPAGSGTPAITPMQKKVDENWAGTLVDWASGGSSDFVKQLNELDGVIGLIDAGKELSGPGTGFFPFGVGRNILGAEGLDAQQTVEGVVQRNLRAVLGAQFTQAEGDRLISRAYDPNLEEDVNKRRLLRLRTQMQIAADQKTDAMNYYNQNGTMVGYTGHIPTMEDFEAALDDEDNQNDKRAQGPQVNWTQPTGAQPQGNRFQWGAPTNRPQTAQADTPPPGIDPDDWKYMSPEDKAKFR